MKFNVKSLKCAVAAAVLLGLILLLLPSVGKAGPVIVQTTGNRFTAAAGNTGRAVLSILVVDPVDGTPVANLGGDLDNPTDGCGNLCFHTGWGFAIIQAPSGSNATGFKIPLFDNRGNGRYLFEARINNSVGNIINWTSGEYHYTIRILPEAGLPDPGGLGFNGSGLGVIVIP